MLRSVLAILAGPVVFGLVCVPTNWLIVKLFPGFFDEQWNTEHRGMLALLVSLTILFAGASGLAGGWIARENVMLHTAVMCLLQIGIGIMVQRQYWTVLPLWYHLTFFALLVAGIFLGGWMATLAYGDSRG